MTLVSQIITDGLRETNIIALGQSPNAAESEEALRRLQNIVSSVYGHEAGDLLSDLPLGAGSTVPTQFPWYGNTLPQNTVVPLDVRLVLSLSAASTVYLYPAPADGSRLAVIDATGSLDTYNLTLNANGRQIEASSTLVLSTEGLAREWFYRADLGEWVRISDLATTDEMPFPAKFDDMFIVMLAMRLNPRFGTSMTQESLAAFNRSRAQFRSQYRSKKEVPSELGILRLTNAQGRWVGWDNNVVSTGARFTSGRPY